MWIFLREEKDMSGTMGRIGRMRFWDTHVHIHVVFNISLLIDHLGVLVFC